MQNFDNNNRLLGALTKGLAARGLQAKIHHGSGERSPAMAHLVLRRSTKVALSPCHLQNKAAMMNLTDPPLPPPRPTRSGERSAIMSSKGGTQNLLRRSVEEEAAVGCSNHRSSGRHRQPNRAKVAIKTTCTKETNTDCLFTYPI
jgi:hypothetical protein